MDVFFARAESPCSQLHCDLFVVFGPGVYTYMTKPPRLIVCSPSRPAADGGPHAVPCWLGFGEGDQLLRRRGPALQAGTVLARLGILRGDRRDAGELPVCCFVRAGRDRNLKRQGSGGNRGGEESDLPALSLQKPRGNSTPVHSLHKISSLLKS